MGGGKLADRRQIGRIGAVLVGKLLATQVFGRAISGREIGHSHLQCLPGTAPDDHAHFKPLLWIGRGEHSRALHCDALASFESNFSHGLSLAMDCDGRRSIALTRRTCTPKVLRENTPNSSRRRSAHAPISFHLTRHCAARRIASHAAHPMRRRPDARESVIRSFVRKLAWSVG